MYYCRIFVPDETRGWSSAAKRAGQTFRPGCSRKTNTARPAADRNMNRLLQRAFCGLWRRPSHALPSLSPNRFKSKAFPSLPPRPFSAPWLSPCFSSWRRSNSRPEWKFLHFHARVLVRPVGTLAAGGHLAGLGPGDQHQGGVSLCAGLLVLRRPGQFNPQPPGLGTPREFDLKTPKRIAVIGDSFVEAVEVHRTRNHAWCCCNNGSGRIPLIGRCWGWATARHLAGLPYRRAGVCAKKYFHPWEAIIYVYLGNDIAESLPALVHLPPASYLYYDLGKSNQLVLNPGSAACRANFVQHLELNHDSKVLASLLLLLTSHCMTIQATLSARGDALFLGGGAKPSCGRDVAGRRPDQQCGRPATAGIGHQPRAFCPPTKRGSQTGHAGDGA